MSKFQKAVYVLVSLCFAAVVVLGFMGYWRLPSGGRLSPEKILKSLPIYRFLEKETTSPTEDRETYDKILQANRAYLKKKVLEENSTQENGTVQNDAQEDGTVQNGAQEDGTVQNGAQENGMLQNNGQENVLQENASAISGDAILETEARQAAMVPQPMLDLSPEKLADYNYMLSQFYIVDPNTAASEAQLNAAEFLNEDMGLESDSSKPQILIYHSHSQEGFADSDLSDPQQRIVGVGTYLTQLLEENYGYNVIHVEEEFDVIDGEVDRARAYDFSEAYVSQVLEENPSIEVVIDLHRDGVPDDQHLVTEINGKPTARIMNFNGLSYTLANGPVDYLPNPYIQDNLAFSFQLIYQAAMYYPELYRGNYLAGLRYNLQLRPKALLLEAGAQTNTLQEVKNAMEPFADILDRVLSAQ